MPTSCSATSRAAPCRSTNATFASCSGWSGIPMKGRPDATAVCTLPWRPAATARSSVDRRKVAEQQRCKARHALDAELGRDAVEARGIEVEAHRACVVQPPADLLGEPALERHPDGPAWRRQQASLEDGRKDRACVLGDERDTGEARREQRGQCPAGDRDGHRPLAKERRLGGDVLADLLVAPHALVDRTDAGNRADERHATRRRPAQAEQVVRNAGGAELRLVGPTVRRDMTSAPRARSAL